MTRRPAFSVLGERLAQQLRHEAVVVHRDVHDLRLVRGERAQRADVRRAFGDHDVTRVAEQPRDHVQAHLGADGHDDVVRVCLDALEGHDFADLLTQHGDAVRRAVLQGDQAVFGDDLRHLRGQRVERERGQVRHAAGERDDLGPAGHREQRPDLGGGHPGGARGVPLEVRVEVLAAAVRLAGAVLGHRRFTRGSMDKAARRGHGRSCRV